MKKHSESETYGLNLDRAALASVEPQLLNRVRQMVEVESPSDDKAAVDRCIEAVAEMAAAIGGRARRHRQRDFGDVVELRFGPSRGGSRKAATAREPLMLLGTSIQCGRWGHSRRCRFVLPMEEHGDRACSI